jgi:phosphonate transport system substrate-binding protein
MTSTGPNRSRRLSLAALVALLGIAKGAAAATGTPLRVGLAPYLSPAALLAAFRPLREHLERTLDRPVEMVTAKDFRALVEATRAGEYDVVLLPAHVARLAVADWRYEPVAATLDVLNVLVLVRAGGPVAAVADLRGGKAGMLDSLSLTAAVGMQWLQEQGLTNDVTTVALPSINSALISLDRGEVAMVVAGSSQLLNLPEGTPRSERILATVRDIPGPIYLARAGMSAAELARVRAAFVAFAPDPARAATAANAALHPVQNELLVKLEPFATQARHALARRP